MSRDDHVPPAFYSEYSGRPFERCLDCDTELASVNHIVQKFIVGDEAVFEMAVCMSCVDTLRQEFSQESRQAVERSVREAMQERREREAATPPPDDLPGDAESIETPGSAHRGVGNIQECLICAVPRMECHRYHIASMFIVYDWLPAETNEAQIALPMMVCDRCNSRISEQISQQTRDAWDRYVEEHFDGPPGAHIDRPSEHPVMF
ncbi:hypothetical protein Mal4_48500 [Maioricimonas rarisocia]|uniref:Uncharacterized protein n=1 Tax=Maioricimonas rarisocia TaxID=2528026 RepID=A0A517ZDF2_9PLAN|nr:hypothetical protein [Maioricimonas rarisocia]QDU40492.1 hypothetical protein Mal4_48500 [Maioricimonas rarisocia]